MAIPEVIEHYARTQEEIDRLNHGGSLLEFARTKEILSRFLPNPPATVLDIGGATGAYSKWLAAQGYTVHLVDPVPFHIEQSKLNGNFTCELGDALHLTQENDSFDTVLLFGPMYHLTERSDRIQALKEAFRVLKKGGNLFVATISRFASLLDGVKYNFLTDPDFRSIVERDLKEGQHRNPTQSPGWFTTAYFHHPDEIKYEVGEAGFSVQELFGIEGPGWMMRDVEERWKDEAQREVLMYAARAAQCEPTLRGLSAHMLCVATKG